MDTAYIIDEDGFVTHLKTKGLLDSGAEAVFIPISKKVGLKGFETKSEAERSLERQEQAFAVGVAPKVLSPVLELIMPVGKTVLAGHYSKRAMRRTVYQKKHRRVFGYKTQIATNIGERVFRTPEFRNLQKALRKLGFCSCDLHYQNMGRVGKKLVCIDFGDMSA
ncbi:MAG: hypothetical protein ACYSUN_12330 [Planctomycetota bacterium]|jgi:hypothetical protein